jgi:hypothetical protein
VNRRRSSRPLPGPGRPARGLSVSATVKRRNRRRGRGVPARSE